MKCTNEFHDINSVACLDHGCGYEYCPDCSFADITHSIQSLNPAFKGLVTQCQDCGRIHEHPKYKESGK